MESPISLGRAGYWEGRALEALGRDDDAQAAYAFGAEYQTSFYGQLAAERGDIPTDPALLGKEEYPDWRNASFLESTVLVGIEAAGDINEGLAVLLNDSSN